MCDFGISKIQEESRDLTVGIGTVAYMPPEMMNMDSVKVSPIPLAWSVGLQ